MYDSFVRLDMHALAIVYMWYVMYFASTIPSLASSFFLLFFFGKKSTKKYFEEYHDPRKDLTKVCVP